MATGNNEKKKPLKILLITQIRNFELAVSSPELTYLLVHTFSKLTILIMEQRTKFLMLKKNIFFFARIDLHDSPLRVVNLLYHVWF